MNKKILVICGPTASGKTNFAHQFAKNNKGEIVNADSMQLYKDIPIITASPEEHLKTELPYHLYNFLDVSCHYSVAKYIETAAEKIRAIAKRDKLPVLVGGSGMYINALINGLSYIPEITQEIRSKAREIQKSLSSEEFFDLLKQTDPEAAKALNAKDSQRVARAYEVYLQTGNSILSYQKNPTKLLVDFDFKVILILPERKFLYSMCNQRLEQMFQNGGIEEVERLITEHKDTIPFPILNQTNEFQGEAAQRNNLREHSRDLQNSFVSFKMGNGISLSVIKALGVQEIIAYLHGNISKEEALEKAQKRTRQYAKRQITWFNHQIKNKVTIDPNKSSFSDIIFK